MLAGHGLNDFALILNLFDSLVDCLILISKDVLHEFLPFLVNRSTEILQLGQEARMLLAHCFFDLREPVLNPPQYDVYDECLVLLKQVASLDSHLGSKGVECTFKSSARHA